LKKLKSKWYGFYFNRKYGQDLQDQLDKLYSPPGRRREYPIAFGEENNGLTTFKKIYQVLISAAGRLRGQLFFRKG